MSKQTNDGKKGGMLKGNSHDNGGIKAVVVDTGQPVELEGGEIIINKKSAKKHRKLLSEINQDGGGVPIPAPDEYKYGGEVVEFNRNDKPNTFAIKFARKIKKDMPELWKKYGNSFENNLYEVLDKVFERGYWKADEKDKYKIWKMYCFNNHSKTDIDGIIGMFKCGAVTSEGYSAMKQKVEQLHKGIEVEKEHSDTVTKISKGHTTPEEGAEMIAKDHLKESDIYYDELEDLEKGFKHKMGSGGAPDVYKKWRSLVNMSKSELEKFYNSEEGKKAGLSASEAKSQGISSGRESARWIMKMKDTPVNEWTDTMWKWAGKQISFISRMKGNKGGLYEEDGTKTRKHLSLLIWGHNPKKMGSGGKILDQYGFVSLVDTNGMTHFKLYNHVPTNKEVYDDFKKIGITVVESDINVEKYSGFNQEQFVEMLDKTALKEFGSKIDRSGLLFKIDSHNFHVYEFDAELNSGKKVKVKMVDGVILIHEIKQEKLDETMQANNHLDNDEESMRKGGALGLKKPSGSIQDQYNQALNNLTQAEKYQEDAKTVNKILRDLIKDKGDKLTNVDIAAELEANGLSSKWLESIRHYADGRKKVAAFVLTNNRSYIKRMQDKVNLLKTQLDRSSSSDDSGEDKYTFADGHILINPEIDRVQIIFDETYVPKPLYSKLRSNGWVFSRTNGAFQRKLTPQAIDNAVNMFNAKKEGETVEKKVEKVETRISPEAALEMVDSRQFSYVTVYLRKAVKDTGYDDNTYPRLVYLSQLSHEVKDGVRTYFKKHFPKLDVDNMEIAVYKKTYVRESRDLIKRGHYLPSDESPDKVLGEKLASELSKFFAEGAEPPKKETKQFYFTQNSYVKRIENGVEEDDFFKRGESITGHFESHPDILSSLAYIVSEDGKVKYEVDFDQISKEKVDPSRQTYKIDGKTYDLTDLELPEDHPIMILDTDSPQWKSAVKEYFEEKETEPTPTETPTKSLGGYSVGDQISVNTITGIKEKGTIKEIKGNKILALMDKTTTGSLSEFSLRKPESSGQQYFVKVGYSKDDMASGGYFSTKQVEETNEPENSRNGLKAYQSPAGLGKNQMWYIVNDAGWFLKDANSRNETHFAANTMFAQSFLEKSDAEDFIKRYLENPASPAPKSVKVEKTEITEPNTGDEFDEAVMEAIEPKDDWIGHLIKERDVKKQIADLIQGGDENERQIAVDRIYQKYYNRELEKSDKWTSDEDWYAKVKSILNTETKDSTKSELLMDSYSVYLGSARELSYKPEAVVSYILEKESEKYPELKFKDEETGFISPDPVQNKIKSSEGLDQIVDQFKEMLPEPFKGIDFNYKNQYALNKAIEALIDDRGDSPKSYDAEEKNFIRKYSGYGGLGDFGEVGKGGLYEFYTPPEVIERMWGLAYKYGYNDGAILEPAVGTGEFLHFMPKNAEVVAYDINEYSSKIVKISFPTVQMNIQPFEQLFISKNYTVKDNIDHLKKFDLVIGNPPYGSFDDFQSRFMSMGEKDHVKPRNYVEYFLRRSVDLLNPDGLLVFIVGAQLKNGGTMFLDSGETPVKEYLAKHTEFITAYRLPDTVFERTGVTSDIIVLKKK